MAWSLIPGRWAALVAVVYGTIFIVWQLGRHLQEGLWLERAQELGRRLWTFLAAVAGGRPNEDGLMFVLLMAAVFWGLAFLSVYHLIRHRSIWWAVLPVGAVLVINAYTYLGRPDLRSYVGFYVLVALLLAARMEFKRRQQGWQRLGVKHSPDVIFPILTAGFVAAAALVFAAWVGPAFAQSEAAADFWGKATRPWLDIREDLGDSLRGLRSPAAYSYEVYGPQLTLKAGSVPEAAVILRIIAERLEPDRGRYYWRARVYDSYSAGRWSILPTETVEFYPSYENLAPPDSQGRQIVEVAVEPLLPATQILYVLPQPVWVSRSVEMGVLRSNDVVHDVSSVSAPGVVVAGERYRVRGLHAEPTAPELRAASTAYPTWVTDRYLQVPEELTDRTRALSERLTARHDNPYDKTISVVEWLRENIVYDRVGQAPPDGVEPLDWFLFDYQRGFCEWYASSAVLLLRQAGIPARMAAGYAQGTLRQEVANLPELADTDAVYEVNAQDAHTWPEVYFPGYGWVEFEPTGNQPELARPERLTPAAGPALPTADSTPADDVPFDPGQGERNIPEDQDLAENAISRIAAYRPALWALVVLALIVAAAGLWLRSDPVAWTYTMRAVTQGMRRARVQPPGVLRKMTAEDMTVVAVIYRHWLGWLPRLGLRPAPGATPFERAHLLASSHPTLADPSWQVVSQYAWERYGGQAADGAELRRLWRSLEIQMLRTWVSRGWSS